MQPAENEDPMLCAAALRIAPAELASPERAAQELRESERRCRDMLRNLELVSVMLDRHSSAGHNCGAALTLELPWAAPPVHHKNSEPKKVIYEKQNRTRN
jgi:hypothetical protein